MKKLVFISVLCMFFWSESNAQFYVGGSIGNSFNNIKISDINGDSFKFDGNSFGWKVYAGYELGGFLGVEGGYRDLGRVKNTTDGQSTYIKTTGGDIAGKGTINLGPLAAFAKAGAFFASQKVDDLSYKSSNTSFLWGLGAGLNLGGLGLRLEYESFGASNNSKSMLTLGATLKLGGE